MTNAWLPGWLGAAWLVVFVLIVAAHVWHATAMPGRDRVWHATHIVMAAGMGIMFVPTDRMPISAETGAAVFAVATIALAGGLLVAWLRGAGLGPLWLLSLVDLAAMVYMFVMMNTRPEWLSVLAVAWYGLQAAGWAGGWLTTVLTGQGLGLPHPEPDRPLVARPAAVAEAPGAARRPGRPSAAPSAGPAPNHHGVAHLVSIRVTLTAMSAGMGYMFLAMQFGMSMMPGM